MAFGTITVEGVEKLRGKLHPAILESVVREGFQEIGEIAKAELEQRAPVWTGLLAKSVIVQTDDQNRIPEFVAIGPTKPHTHLVALGVKPHFPPWRADQGKWARHLRRWTRQHFDLGLGTLRGTDRETALAQRQAALDRATFLLARAISRRGVKGRHFIAAAFNAVAPQLDNVISDMVDRLEEEWEQ